MKREILMKLWNQHKKRFFAGACAIVIASSCLVGCGNNESKTTKEEEIAEEVVDVDYLQYVKGLKDWTVEVNTNPNFMEGVEWNEEYIVGVMCDSSKVDMAKEGEYDILYMVQTSDEDDVEVTKHCTVKVVASAEADKLAESGQEVVTDEGIKNKKEAVASSITDKGVKVESEGEKVVVKKDDNGNISGSVNKPSKPNKPSGGNSNKPSKPSGGNDNNKPSKPEHSHKWEEVYKKVDKGSYQNVKVKDAWEEKVKVKDAWTETKKVLVKDAWEEPIYEYRTICKGCQAQFKTVDECLDHMDWHFENEGRDYNYTTKKVQVGTKHHDAVYETKTINHPAEYKTVHHDAVYEKKWVSKWVNEISGYKCSCGAKK